MSNRTVSGPSSSHPRSPRRRRWLALLLLPVAAGVLTASVASAHGFGGHRGGGMAFMQQRMDHLLTAAGASDAQKTQIKGIWDKLQPQLASLHKQHAEARRAIGQAVAAPTIDVAKVEQLRKQSVDTTDKISALMTQGMVASAQVLTPDQRKLALQKIEERHHRHGGPDQE